MGTVVDFTIPPKQDNFRHRRTEYKLEYDPVAKAWKWSFVLVTAMNITGHADSFEQAKTAAKTHIDLASGG